MKIYRLDCTVFIETTDEYDPEDLATEFHQGLDGALQPFALTYDNHEILDAGVENIREATDQEINDAGLIE